MQKTLSLKTLAPCLYAIIIDAMGFGLVYPTMTAIFTSHNSPVLPIGVTEATRNFYLGIAFLLYPLFMFFGTAMMSDLSDRYGRKRILWICMLGIAASFALMGLGTMLGSLALLFIGRGLSGLLAGSQPVAQAVIADLSTPEKKARNMGIVTFSYCAGVTLGPLLGGFLSDKNLWSGLSLSTPFYVAAVLSLLAFFWVVFSFTDTFTPKTTKPFHMLRPLTIFIEAFQDKRIRILSIGFLLCQLGYSVYFQFIPVHMRLAFHYANWQIGAVNAMLGIGFGVGLIVFLPLLTKFLNTKRLTIVTSLAVGVLQLVASVIYIAWPQWPIAILVAASQIIAFTAFLTLYSDNADSSKQGWALGIANAMVAFAWTITGFASNLIPALGTEGIIGLGGVLLILGVLWLKMGAKKLAE